MPDSEKSKYDIELPQSIIDSLARYLVSEIRAYYDLRKPKGIRGVATTAGQRHRTIAKPRRSR